MNTGSHTMAKEGQGTIWGLLSFHLAETRSLLMLLLRGTGSQVSRSARITDTHHHIWPFNMDSGEHTGVRRLMQQVFAHNEASCQHR